MNSDYSDLGSEFVDFLSALMGSRMLNAFHDCDVTSRWTFKESIDFLERAKMVRVDDSGGWEPSRIPLVDAEGSARLGVIDVPVVPVEVKKRGRPKGRGDTKQRKQRSDKKGP